MAGTHKPVLQECSGHLQRNSPCSPSPLKNTPEVLPRAPGRTKEGGKPQGQGLTDVPPPPRNSGDPSGEAHLNFVRQRLPSRVCPPAGRRQAVGPAQGGIDQNMPLLPIQVGALILGFPPVCPVHEAGEEAHVCGAARLSCLGPPLGLKMVPTLITPEPVGSTQASAGEQQGLTRRGSGTAASRDPAEVPGLQGTSAERREA